jgi:membrane-associated protein
VSSIVSHILHFHGFWAYALVGGLCFCESALIITFFIPGETALVFGGVLTSEHHVSLGIMIAVAVVSTAVGYFVGFGIGRAVGPRLFEMRLLSGRDGVARARATIVDRGALAVFVARFIPVVRALMPGVAGASGVDAAVFARANLVGAAVWGAGYVVAGFLVGQAYQRFIKDAATVGEVLLGVAVALFVVHRIRARRRRLQPSDNSRPTRSTIR